MEVYFKNLSAEETPTERLVEDVMMLAEEAEGLVKAAGATLTGASREEIKSAVERIKVQCQKIKEQALAGARSTDKLIRRHPYASAGVAFGVGVLVGVLWGGRSSE